jgi:hypothetical protein
MTTSISTLGFGGFAVRLGTAVFALACACAPAISSVPGQGSSPAPVPRTTAAATTPLMPGTWPVRTREHVDLWLHAYALLNADTTLVPYFRPGYGGRLAALRKQRGISTQLDANRARLLERLAVNPALATNGQFLALYFASWEQMRQTIELFVRAGGNPGASNDANTRAYISILASAFPSAPDRDWLRLFSASVDDESRRFYHDYWTAEQRSHATTVARVDSLWQQRWRPTLQRFLNNSQQQNGELYLSLPLGGEGRTIHFGKQENAVAVSLPDAPAQSDVALFVFVHEIAGTVASAAIEDNTTPADRRSGATSRFEQAAAVRAGALLLERTIPAVVPGYMRYYLQTAGRQAPNDPRTTFTTTFAIPDAVRDAIARQLDVILGGI